MANMIWRAVPGYPDVEVNSIGEVRTENGLLSPHDLDGYVTVFVNSVRQPVLVHRLVALAFHGTPPDGKPMALHRDGVRNHNTPGNIYWGDAVDNAEDARRHGTLAKGKRHGAHTHPDRFPGRPSLNPVTDRKLGPDDVRFIREHYKPKHPVYSGKALAQQYGVDPATIRKVHAGTTYRGVI